MSDQPPPTPNESRHVVDVVIDDLRARADVGERKYGVKLQAHNGRRALRDAYEEVLDLAQYIRQEMIERERLEADLDLARTMLTALRTALSRLAAETSEAP